MGKADLHLHTTASDGMMSPAMLMNYAAACTDLDLVAITDHNTIDGWSRAREFQLKPENDHLAHIDLVPGIEVSTRSGHVLGIGIQEVIPRNLSVVETIEAIHEQGGLALAPHPLAWVPGLKDFAGVGKDFMSFSLDGVEVRNSNATEIFNNHRVAWINRRLKQPIAEYGSSDAHFLWVVGRVWTDFPGRGFSAFREALLHRTTRARGIVWGPFSLMQYFRDRSRWQKFCQTHGVRLHDL